MQYCSFHLYLNLYNMAELFFRGDNRLLKTFLSPFIDLKVHSRVHNSPLLNPNPNQLNTVGALENTSLR